MKTLFKNIDSTMYTHDLRQTQEFSRHLEKALTLAQNVMLISILVKSTTGKVSPNVSFHTSPASWTLNFESVSLKLNC